MCNLTFALFRRLIFPFLLAAHLAAAEPVLDTVSKLRALSAEEAARGLPVRIEATVIYFDHGPKYVDLFVRDDTASTYVASEGPQFLSLCSMPLKPGLRVRIEGVTRRGGFFPDLLQRRVELIGDGEMPVPPRITEDELFAPELDSQWVKVPAVVTGVESGGLAFTLAVEVYGWKLTAEIPRDEHSAERARALMQRPVILEGIAGTVFNNEQQMTGWGCAENADKGRPT